VKVISDKQGRSSSERLRSKLRKWNSCLLKARVCSRLCRMCRQCCCTLHCNSGCSACWESSLEHTQSSLFRRSCRLHCRTGGCSIRSQGGKWDSQAHIERSLLRRVHKPKYRMQDCTDSCLPTSTSSVLSMKDSRHCPSCRLQ
jgi:hypothetical protein